MMDSLTSSEIPVTFIDGDSRKHSRFIPNIRGADAPATQEDRLGPNRYVQHGEHLYEITDDEAGRGQCIRRVTIDSLKVTDLSNEALDWETILERDEAEAEIVGLHFPPQSGMPSCFLVTYQRQGGYVQVSPGRFVHEPDLCITLFQEYTWSEVEQSYVKSLVRLERNVPFRMVYMDEDTFVTNCPSIRSDENEELTDAGQSAAVRVFKRDQRPFSIKPVLQVAKDAYGADFAVYSSKNTEGNLATSVIVVARHTQIQASHHLLSIADNTTLKCMPLPDEAVVQGVFRDSVLYTHAPGGIHQLYSCDLHASEGETDSEMNRRVVEHGGKFRKISSVQVAGDTIFVVIQSTNQQAVFSYYADPMTGHLRVCNGAIGSQFGAYASMGAQFITTTGGAGNKTLVYTESYNAGSRIFSISTAFRGGHASLRFANTAGFMRPLNLPRKPDLGIEVALPTYQANDQRTGRYLVIKRATTEPGAECVGHDRILLMWPTVGGVDYSTPRYATALMPWLLQGGANPAVMMPALSGMATHGPATLKAGSRECFENQVNDFLCALKAILTDTLGRYNGQGASARRVMLYAEGLDATRLLWALNQHFDMLQYVGAIIVANPLIDLTADTPPLRALSHQIGDARIADDVSLLNAASPKTDNLRQAQMPPLLIIEDSTGTSRASLLAYKSQLVASNISFATATCSPAMRFEVAASFAEQARLSHVGVKSLFASGLAETRPAIMASVPRHKKASSKGVRKASDRRKKEEALRKQVRKGMHLTRLK